jgi:hypothetical protein
MEGTEPFRESPDHAGRGVCCQHGSPRSAAGPLNAPAPAAISTIRVPGPTPTMSSAVFETGTVIRCAVAS